MCIVDTFGATPSAGSEYLCPLLPRRKICMDQPSRLAVNGLSGDVHSSGDPDGGIDGTLCEVARCMNRCALRSCCPSRPSGVAAIARPSRTRCPPASPRSTRCCRRRLAGQCADRDRACARGHRRASPHAADTRAADARRPRSGLGRTALQAACARARRGGHRAVPARARALPDAAGSAVGLRPGVARTGMRRGVRVAARARRARAAAARRGRARGTHMGRAVATSRRARRRSQHRCGSRSMRRTGSSPSRC